MKLINNYNHNTALQVNRIAWIVIFLVGAFWFAVLEWDQDTSTPMVWFLATGLWSAFCGIGYTVMAWFFSTKNGNNSTNYKS